MRGSLSKNDMIFRLNDLKIKLHNRSYVNWSQEQYDAANTIVNEMLDILNEYAR